jgi:hypothetical protein
MSCGQLRQRGRRTRQDQITDLPRRPAVSIAVDPDDLEATAPAWGALADDVARLRGAVQLAAATAAMSAGHPLVSAELDRFWARWGSAFAVRVSDLDLLGRLAASGAEAYRSLEMTVARNVR